MSAQEFDIRSVPRWWPQPGRPPERSFTSAALEVLDDVEGLAAARGVRGLVPPVVVLWCVLRRWDKHGRLGLAVLEACGVDRQSLEHDIEEELRPRFGSPEPVLDFGAIYEVALRANEEAASFGDNWVGTEHLVLALFGSGDGVVGKLFQKHAVGPETFKAMLAEMLHR